MNKRTENGHKVSRVISLTITVDIHCNNSGSHDNVSEIEWFPTVSPPSVAQWGPLQRTGRLSVAKFVAASTSVAAKVDDFVADLSLWMMAYYFRRKVNEYSTKTENSFHQYEGTALGQGCWCCRRIAENGKTGRHFRADSPRIIRKEKSRLI